MDRPKPYKPTNEKLPTITTTIITTTTMQFATKLIFWGRPKPYKPTNEKLLHVNLSRSHRFASARHPAAFPRCPVVVPVLVLVLVLVLVVAVLIVPSSP